MTLRDFLGDYRLEAGVWTPRTGSKPFAYSDGDDVEQRLLELVGKARDKSLFSQELRDAITDWPSQYHLSAARANLLRPFERKLAGSRILEVGAGCGAVTRFLGESGAQVVALEGSFRRARIARERTGDLANVTIVCDRIEDFSPGVKFDVVCLVGVLEYARTSLGGGAAAERALLQKLAGLLESRGALVVAIENQLGLKYFAGAAEDHTGTPFHGINDQYGDATVVTFARPALSQLLKESGLSRQHWYYPFPDYKLPNSIIAEECLNKLPALASALAAPSTARDAQRPARPPFSLEAAWDIVARNGLLGELANSFLVVAAADKQTLEGFKDGASLAWHYSVGSRHPAFYKQACFGSEKHGHLVRRIRLADAAPPSVPIQCTIRDEPYISGQNWWFGLVRLTNKTGWGPANVAEWCRPWIELLMSRVQGELQEDLTYLSSIGGKYLDAVPANIIVDDAGGYHFIDQEWSIDQEIDLRFLLYRGLQASFFLLTSVADPQPGTPTRIDTLIKAVFAALGIPVSELELGQFHELERKIQQWVQGRASENIAWHAFETAGEQVLTYRGELGAGRTAQFRSGREDSVRSSAEPPDRATGDFAIGMPSDAAGDTPPAVCRELWKNARTARLLGPRGGIELEYPVRIVNPPAWVGHIPFAFWLVNALRPHTIVELGVHTGNSYCAFVQAVRALDLDARCFGIDHWRGDQHAGYYDDDVYAELRAFHDPLYGDFSTLLRSTFAQAVHRFADGEVDLLHIDGLHTYDAVSQDFSSWLGKMSSRGIVLFHDTKVRDQGFGIWRMWQEIVARYPTFEFHHSHGLGVAYVGTAPLSAALKKLFATRSPAETALIRAYFARLGTSVHERFALGEVASALTTEAKRGDHRVHERDEELRRLSAEVAERDRRLTAADLDLRRALQAVHGREQRLVAADQKLRRLLSEIENREQRLAIADQELRRLLSELEQREQRLTAADQELRHLLAEVEHRDQRLIAADSDRRRAVQEAEEREQRLVAADQEVRHLLSAMADRDGRLLAADADLRRLLEEVEFREQRLVVAGQELRHLLSEIEHRDQRLMAADEELRHLLSEAERRDERLVAADQELRHLLSEVEHRDERLVAADQELRHLLSEVEHRDERLIVADQELRHLLSEVEHRDQHLVGADGELRRLLGLVEERERRLGAADQELRHLLSAAEDRDGRLLAADRELRRLLKEIEAREQRLTAADQELRHLLSEVAHRDARLLAADGELRRLLGEVEERERRVIGADQALHDVVSRLEERERRLLAAVAENQALAVQIQEISEQLTSAETRLEAIETSMLWRMRTSVQTFARNLRPAKHPRE